MSADLTCPKCNGDRSIRFRWGVAACDCHDGRRLPELDEWDALKAERDEIEQEFAVLASERDRYQLALEIICQTPFSPVEEAHRTARAALDSEDSTMIAAEEAIRDAEAALEDHYAYGSDDG